MIPKSLTKRVLERDHHACVLALPGCNHTATIADHRVNRGHGGSKVLNDMAVLIAACWPCNGKKEDLHGSELAEIYRRGLKVKPASTHQASLERCQITPVELLDGTECILTSSGLRLGVGAVNREVSI